MHPKLIIEVHRYRNSLRYKDSQLYDIWKYSLILW